jgi:eukaryotic-like serine/threonine-protein kinase
LGHGAGLVASSNEPGGIAMTVTKVSWEQVKELLHEAMQIAPQQRSGFLDEACSSNDSLRAEIESLLAAGEEIRLSFLESANQAGELEWDGDGTSGHLEAGHIFAERFHILRKLGEGGMGQIWLADQTSPVRRQVALKLIKAGMYDSAVVHRFQSERQALAIMDHPAIAKVFEAGATPQGQPYFVMEYVPGLPITEYCDEKKLRISERIELFIQSCEGVQHAHQKAIIHRDLKPANILVIEVDGKPVPRIIDFGLAKATTPVVGGEGQFTQLGHFMGTPGYISPEQADPSIQDIDTRTDVYSLGVVLYVLLTGTQPIDTKHWQQQPLDELLRKLREEEPPPPSSRINSERNKSTATAEARGTESRQLVSLLRGDLDWITMKALEKDRGRRYGTPSDIAVDLRRYLNHEPVEARPASAGYKLRKYLRRHAALAAGAAAVLVVLAGGIIASTSLAIRAGRASRAAITERDRAVEAEARIRIERDRATAADQAATRDRNRALAENGRANEEAASAEAVSNFLQNDLLAQASADKQARPNASPDPDLKVRTALDRAAAGIEGKFAKQPLVEASIRRTIGVAYAGLGIYPEAQIQFEKALELRQRVLGNEHPDTLIVDQNLAAIYLDQGKYSKAETLLSKTIEAQDRILGEQNPETLTSMYDLADVYVHEEKLAQAEPLFASVLRARRRVLGDDDPATLISMYALGRLYQEQGKFAQAEPLVKDALERQRRKLGENHPEILLSMNSLASLYVNENKYAQAEPLYLETLDIERRTLGEEHRYTVFTLNSLAYLYQAEGKFAQAETYYAKTFDLQRRMLGEEHNDTLSTAFNLATVYSEEGKYAQAESLFLKTLEADRRRLGEDHPETLRVTNNLASLYVHEEKFEQAEPLFAKVFEIRSRILGPGDRATLLSMNNLAEIYEMQGKYAQAEPLLIKALESRRQTLGEENTDTLVSMEALGKLYRSEGKYTQAEPLLKQAADVDRRVLGEEHPQTLSSLDDLALLYRNEREYEKAEALFASVLETRRRVLGPAHPDTTDAMVELAEVRLQEENYAAAEALLREAAGAYEKTASDSWERWQAESLLGASLAGQSRYAESETLLVSGLQGMIDHQAMIPFEDRSALTQSGEWILQLYERWARPEKAAEWRSKLCQGEVPALRDSDCSVKGIVAGKS